MWYIKDNVMYNDRYKFASVSRRRDGWVVLHAITRKIHGPFKSLRSALNRAEKSDMILAR